MEFDVGVGPPYPMRRQGRQLPIFEGPQAVLEGDLCRIMVSNYYIHFSGE